VPVGVPGSPLNHAAAFALTFLCALVVWALLAVSVKLIWDGGHGLIG
jgi:hypothetical protein